MSTCRDVGVRAFERRRLLNCSRLSLCARRHSATPSDCSLGPDGWPPTCPVQVHFAEGDPLRHQPVIDALAERVRKSGARFEQHSYAGSGHHFSDPDWPGYSESASVQMFENVCAFLDSLGS